MLGFPIEFVRTDGAEGGQSGPEDVEVEVVAEVEPDGDEEAKVRSGDW